MSTHNTFDSEFFHKILVIDIETVPIFSHFEELDSAYKSHWTKKHLQSSKYTHEDIAIEESFLQRAGIYAEFGKVICISLGRIQMENNEVDVKIKSYYGDDEKMLLEEFFSDLLLFSNKWSDVRLAGHNIREFDIPFICRRALIHGLSLPKPLRLQGLKPWQIEHIDSLELWKFGDYKHYVSLDLLAHILGVESSKTDIDGSQVAEQYWKYKDLQRIVTYCEKDVRTTTKVISKLLNWNLSFK